jgi:hypothetical protein
LLTAQRRWLPQYQPADLDAAAGRLAEHEKNGTRVRRVQGHGAARLPTKTVAEMARQAQRARQNARAADKANRTAAAPG